MMAVPWVLKILLCSWSLLLAGARQGLETCEGNDGHDGADAFSSLHLRSPLRPKRPTSYATSQPSTPWKDRGVFGRCPKKIVQTKHTPAQAVLTESRRQGKAEEGCSEDEEGVTIFGWVESEYKASCCQLSGAQCSGCAVAGADSCTSCASGYIFRSSTCIPCDDLLWEDAEGRNCAAYVEEGLCDAGRPPEKNPAHEGLRPSDACCACGGGQIGKTPWAYPAGAHVHLFGQAIELRPDPQSADSHAVAEDCDFSRFNLSIRADGVVSGKLPDYSNDSDEDEASCTIAAVQDPLSGIYQETELSVKVAALSYGPQTIMFPIEDDELQKKAKKTWKLTKLEGLKLTSFRLACVPENPKWVSFDEADGTIHYNPTNIGDPLQSLQSVPGRGVQSVKCRVDGLGNNDNDTVSTQIYLVKSFLWSGAYYHPISARLGRPITSQHLNRRPPEGLSAHHNQSGGTVWYKLGSSDAIFLFWSVSKASGRQLWR